MRKSNIFLLYLGVNALFLLVLFIHAAVQTAGAGPLLEKQRQMAARLGLSDLCLFTEASYTRHPSQADLHTPFQDHPLALEHFPSGSLLAPPPVSKRSHGKVH